MKADGTPGAETIPDRVIEVAGTVIIPLLTPMTVLNHLRELLVHQV